MAPKATAQASPGVRQGSPSSNRVSGRTRNSSPASRLGRPSGQGRAGSSSMGAPNTASSGEHGRQIIESGLLGRRPECVAEASRAKFKEQERAGQSKEYGAIGALDYEFSAYVFNTATGAEERRRVFGLSELLTVLKETHSKEEFAALRFLDLGCGDGRSLWHLHDDWGLPWSQLIGITAEDMRGVEVLRGETPFNLRETAGPESDQSYLVWNIDDLMDCPSLRGRQFDVIVSWITWCWLTDPMGDLELVHDHFLAPAGILMIGSMQLMTDAPDAMDDGPILHGLTNLLVSRDGLDILMVADAASGLYNWWIQRKRPGENRGLRLDRFIAYHATEPVHKGSLKATYVVSDPAVTLAAEAYKGAGGFLPSSRLWESPSEAEIVNAPPEGYRSLMEIDIAATVKRWSVTSPMAVSDSASAP